MRKIAFMIPLLSMFSITSNAQLAKPFETKYQSVIKGNVVLVSNNIVNKKSTKNPYNDISEKSKLNDQFVMKYIDIDKDKTTFSSSSADLILENPKQDKIVFAGLYWSATYKYEKGDIAKGEFVVKNSKRNDVNSVKLKFPQAKKYIDIKGEVIYDGHNQKKFSDNAPYAVFADITDYVKQLESPSGTYTVANVRATQGIISGGVSGGWTIVFVYENENEKDRFVTIYDGFAGVSSKEVNIDFHGFKAVPEGNVNATLHGVALEGDLKMEGDQLLFKAEDKEEFSQLQNSIRSNNNFFNSSITLNDSYFLKRNPNSLNTLGYDAFSIQINNPNNSVISNETRKATLQLKSSGDRYFMFMTAFSIEAVEVEKEEELLVQQSLDSESNVTVTEKTPELVSKVKQEEKIQNVNSDRIYPIESDAVIIAGIDEGYYLVSNVFAVPSNATRFVQTLQNKGIDAKYFINPKNNYRYVYMGRRLDFEEAKHLYFSDVNGQYKDEMWIMTVRNKEEESLKHQSVAYKSDNEIKLSDYLFAKE